MENTYMMENGREIQRLEAKTDLDQAKNQLIKCGLKEGMASIDLGCGSGMVTKLISDISSTAKTTGVDKNPDRIKYAPESISDFDTKLTRS